MTTPPTPPPRYRKPSTAPTPAEVADAARWAELVDASLSTTQAAAEKWRTGLAAFVTLVTGGLLVKGPETAHDIQTGWLAGLTGLSAIGLALAVIGLWSALKAAAGSPANANLQDIVEKFGGVRQYEVIAARSASSQLTNARRLVAASLVTFGVALFVWWWAPTKPSDPPAFLKVESGSSKACGELLSADNQRLRLKVAGQESPTVVTLTAVTNLTVVANCG